MGLEVGDRAPDVEVGGVRDGAGDRYRLVEQSGGVAVSAGAVTVF